MLKHYRLALLFVLALLITIAVFPTSAQETSAASGLSVDISEAGVSVFRVSDDGSLSLVVFIPSLKSEAAAEEEAVTELSADIMPDGYLIINTPALNVRTGPGASYTIIGTIAGGDEVHVVGKNDGRENWWFVELEDGQRGWINNIHVLIRGDLTGTPVIEHSGIIIHPTLYIGYPGNPIFPSLPHKGHPTCYLPGRSEFPIIGRSALNNWYEIVATCQDGTAVTGWVEAVMGIVRNPAGVEFPVTN